MLRRLHLVPGLVAAIILIVLSVSGAILALDPLRERLRAGSLPTQETTVAEVAARILRRNEGVDRIVRGPNGTVTVHQWVGDQIVAQWADPRTGQLLSRVEPSVWLDVTRRLHRSLLMGDMGRGAAGVGAAALVLLSLSGLGLLARRLGGWQALARPIRGTSQARWHCEIARAAALGLMLSASTGCYLSLVTFEILPDSSTVADPAAPPGVPSKLTRWVAIERIEGLKAVTLGELREFALPRPGDPAVIRLITSKARTVIDRATGAVIATEPLSGSGRLHEWIYALHTGQGLWPAAVVVGLSALALPVLVVTGVAIWWRRRREVPRIKANSGVQEADTIILVGSEGGATWRFAAGLHAALAHAGYRVHTGSMNALARRYPRAERIILMTSTYADGSAPASATQALKRLGQLETRAAIAVLGFGDRSFRGYCKFAKELTAAVDAKAHARLLPLTCIDRQSHQAFKVWCQSLGRSLGTPIEVDVEQTIPATVRLKLIESAVYGEAVQAPTVILRFVHEAVAAPRRWGALRGPVSSRRPRFEPGDLLGIMAPGLGAPRLYSIGSSSHDGIIEICVRKQPGGACSSWLHDLRAGDLIDAFIKPNPTFRPSTGKTPLVLIGAGAGIAPLVGTIRANRARRPIHLYWGGRHPSSDYLYEGDLGFLLSDRRLTRFRPIFSRLPRGGYVQDRIEQEAVVLRDLVRSGAQIMVCGSSQMAVAVAETIERIIEPMGLDLASLKTRGRYVEDVY